MSGIYEPVVSDGLGLPGNLDFDLTEELLVMFYEGKVTSSDRLFLISRFSKFKSTIEGLYFELEHLPTISNDRLREELLKNFKEQIVQNFIRIRNRSDYGSLREAIKTMIFETLPSNENFNTNKALMDIIFFIQGYFIINMYTEDNDEGKDIMSSICECFASQPDLIYGFIENLSNAFSRKASIIAFDYGKIIEQTALDGSQSALMDVIIEGIKANDENAINALAGMISWMDINILNEYETLQKLKELIISEQALSGVFKCMISFFQRPNELSEIIAIINDFGLHDQLIKYISLETSKSTEITIAADLLKSMLANLMSDEFALGFLDVASTILISICLNNWNRPRGTVTGFIQTLLKNHPEIYGDVIEIGKTICETVVLNAPSDYDQRFSEGIELIKLAARFSEEEFSIIDPINDMMSSIAEGDDFQAKAIVLSGFAKDEHMPTQRTSVLCDMFNNILSVEDEEILKTKEAIEAIINYVKIVTKLAHTDEPERQEMAIELSRNCFITVMHCLSCADAWNTEIGENAIKVLSNLVKKHTVETISTLIENDKLSEILFSLLQFINPQNFELALKLINCAPNEAKITLIPAIIEKLLEVFSERDETTFIQDIKFVGGIDCSELPPEFMECFAGYFEGILPRATYEPENPREKEKYEEIFSQFIISSATILKANSFRFFLEKIVENGERSIIIVSAVAEAAIQLDPSNPDDSVFVGQALDIIMPLIDGFILSDSKESAYQQQKEFLTMSSLFLINVFDGLDDSFKDKTFRFIASSIIKIVQPENVVCPILEFLINHIQDTHEVLSTDYESFKGMINIEDKKYNFPDESFIQPLLRFIHLHSELIKHDSKYIDTIIGAIRNETIKSMYASIIKNDSESKKEEIDKLIGFILKLERGEEEEEEDNADDEEGD